MQGGRVQPKQSDIRLGFNTVKIAKGGFSRAAIEETKYLIKQPQAEVREAKKRGGDFPGHKNVKAEMERQAAMIRQNHMDSCLPCHNGTARNPQTRWRCKVTGSPPPVWRKHPTPDPPHLPLERHLRHPVLFRAHNNRKTTICQPRMQTHVLLFSTLNLSILMHLPRIA